MNLIKLFNKILREEGYEAYHGAWHSPNKDYAFKDPKQVRSLENGSAGRGIYYSSSKPVSASYGPLVTKSKLEFDNPVVLEMGGKPQEDPPDEIYTPNDDIQNQIDERAYDVDSIIAEMEDFPEVDGVVAKNIQPDSRNQDISELLDPNLWDNETNNYIVFDKSVIKSQDTENLLNSDNKELSQLYNSAAEEEGRELEEKIQKVFKNILRNK